VRRFGEDAEPSKVELREAPVHWPRPSVLDVSLTALSGVGPKLAEAAAEAGIATLGDLLLRFPHSHRDRTVVPVADLEPGDSGTVRVEVLGNTPRPFRRRGLSITSVKVGDDSGSLRASWFNQPWIAPKLVPGSALLLTGSRDKRGFRVSEYEFVASGPRVLSQGEGGAAGRAVLDPPPPAPPAGETKKLVPVHPATEQLKAQRIRQWVEQAIELAPNAVEALPAEMRARRGLAAVADAITEVHFPNNEDGARGAEQRLKFEELFLYQAVLAARKRTHRTASPAPRIGKPGELVARWLDSLPFEPTAGQLTAFDEIDADLDSGEPMARLLMGEVGSGKTVVALYAMLRALEAGQQAVLMAPTETLAEQHAATLDRLLGSALVPFALLTGATPAATRKQALNQLASGELGLILGTHALIEPSVRFARLGVCVVDEQHRFGVEQRRALDAKAPAGLAPHVLHMTATPIPRTLSLTAYGDLDTTALRELPAGRSPVETRLVGEADRAVAFELLRGELREGRQAFVVCPLVAESEKQQGRAAEVEAGRLAAGELRGFELGVLHGQLPSAEKAAAMSRFASGGTQVLVATTVIEVGIDVPNATVMLIEGAERYGVSQLHQLRGRVGRGEHRSYCLLVPEDAGELARRRLKAVARTGDGFELAEVDLALRGEGEVLGTRQHGLPRFALAELPEDTPLLLEAREEVLALLREHGSLDAAPLGPLMDAARRRFGATDPIPL
jgi:ATP-dependent DNA helicase RecG